jgi:hypothetical protein
MDNTIIVALVTSTAALLAAFFSAIISRRSIKEQREQVILPMQKEFLNVKIRQLEKIKKDIKAINKRDVKGIPDSKNNKEIKERIATIIAQGAHWMMEELPDLIDEVYNICQRNDLIQLNEKIKQVNEFKGLIQAKSVYGATKNDEKLFEYEKNLNPIDTIHKIENDFLEIIEEEIIKCNKQLNALLNGINNGH